MQAMSYTRENTVALAVTGASGVSYTLRLLEELIRAQRRVWLMISPAAQIVFATESDMKLPATPREQQTFLSAQFNAAEGQLEVFGTQEWMAPVASGSGAPRSMVVCPCTMGMVSAMATGASDNLMERAADVMLKERRNLIVVPRETPLSTIHLQNLLTLAQAGACILPANPGFYQGEQTLARAIDFVVARILDQLEVPQQLLPAWGL
jgi:4-hydroxy-3-polyprenylbenzoate decarboxylase